MKEKMHVVQKTFKRVETKYIVDKIVLADFLADLIEFMEADDFAKSSIANVYFDTENFDVIQDAIAKRHGREKIRMRTYDHNPTETSQAFLEIKQKINEVGHKYRLTSNPVSVVDFMETGRADDTISDDKVVSEMAILRERYGHIKPMMYIGYDRVSFRGREDKKVRLTIDRNLVYRDYDVDVQKGKYGYDLLETDKVIMEIKLVSDAPAWLTDLIDKHQLEEGSFSKYGNAYRLNKERKEGLND